MNDYCIECGEKLEFVLCDGEAEICNVCFDRLAYEDEVYNDYWSDK